MQADDAESWPTGRLLSAAARLVEHEWNTHLSRWDLNHAGLAVLHVLTAGPSTQREIAGRVQVEDQTMSRTLDRLERSGYVERRRDEADRRRVVVTLTAAGRRTCLRASDLAVAEGYFEGAVEDLEGLRRSLVALVRTLSEHRWPAVRGEDAAVRAEDAVVPSGDAAGVVPPGDAAGGSPGEPVRRLSS